MRYSRDRRRHVRQFHRVTWVTLRELSQRQNDGSTRSHRTPRRPWPCYLSAGWSSARPSLPLPSRPRGEPVLARVRAGAVGAQCACATSTLSRWRSSGSRASEVSRSPSCSITTSRSSSPTEFPQKRQLWLGGSIKRKRLPVRHANPTRWAPEGWNATAVLLSPVRWQPAPGVAVRDKARCVPARAVASTSDMARPSPTRNSDPFTSIRACGTLVRCESRQFERGSWRRWLMLLS